MEKQSEKTNKTVYLCNWVIGILDTEGGHSGGPGIVAAAAIYHYSCQSDAKKKKMLEAYNREELSRSFADKNADEFVDDAEADAKDRKQKPGRRPNIKSA